MGRLRIQPNSGQQNDFSDEFYLKKHNHGEMLERKGRKQERDRLIVERNKIKMKIEQLKLEVASASFYANASPIKGISNTSTAINTNTASSTNTTSNTTTNNQQSRQSTPTVSTSTATTFSERMKESERNKRRQLQQAEETLRRYDELLQPREPYVTLSAATAASTSHATGKNTNKDATQLNGPNAPRTWLTGGKGR